MAPRQLTEDYVQETCKPGQGHDCCRYLTFNANGWNCAKWSDLKPLLDERAANETMVARGDNCEGIAA